LQGCLGFCCEPLAFFRGCSGFWPPLLSFALRTGGVCFLSPWHFWRGCSGFFVSPWHICEGAQVFVLCSCPLPWGWVGFAFWAPSIFVRVLSFLISAPVLCLEDGWGLLFEPLAFLARVLGFLTSTLVLCLRTGGVCFWAPDIFCEGAWFFDLRSRPLPWGQVGFAFELLAFFWGCSIFRGCFYSSGGLDKEPCLGQIFTWFYGDEGGSALGHPFWRIWVFRGQVFCIKG
jgi:hypothetical protein